MNILFWNVHNNDKINQLIHEAIEQYSCDVVGLAEYSDDINELIQILGKNRIKFCISQSIGCKRITLLCKNFSQPIEKLYDHQYFTIKRFLHKDYGTVNIAFVHFPSKKQSDESDYMRYSYDLRNAIEKVEEKIKNRNTAIVGDFNMNPFEKGMIFANALHSVCSVSVAKKISRRLGVNNCLYFYNPMWNLFGDNKPPTGSYYYYKSVSDCYFWNIFDQVTIRPELIDNFKLIL